MADTDEPTQRIVIIDDMLPNAMLAAEVVERLDGVSVTVMEEALPALDACIQEPPDLILLDYVMPDLDGLGFLRRLREALGEAFVPVIMVTGETRSGTLAEAMAAGATDFLRKPWDEAELRARTRNMLSLRRSHLALASKNEELRILATTDSLTGVLNRRAFTERTDAELQRIVRYGHRGSLLMMDIDFFKRINDAHGHATGDEVLKAFAAHCRGHLRDVDHLGRLGGEEFAAFLPETDIDGARVVGERMRETLEALTMPGGITLTVSMGASEVAAGDDLDTVMQRADQALYEAKETGRNKLVVAGPPTA